MTAFARKTEPLYALPCRGLGRAEAAHYIGIGVTKFDELVLAGTMPQPKSIGSRKIWDRFALDEAFDRLPSDAEGNSWADV